MPNIPTDRLRHGPIAGSVLYVLVACLILGAIYVLSTTYWAAMEVEIPAGKVGPSVDAPDSGEHSPPAAFDPSGQSPR